MAEDSDSKSPSIDQRNEYYKELREEKAKQKEESEKAKSQEARNKTFKWKLSGLLEKQNSQELFKKTLSSPFNLIAYILKWPLKLISLGLAVFLAIIILYASFNFLSGGGLSILSTETSILSSEGISFRKS